MGEAGGAGCDRQEQPPDRRIMSLKNGVNQSANEKKK